MDASVMSERAGQYLSVLHEEIFDGDSESTSEPSPCSYMADCSASMEAIDTVEPVDRTPSNPTSVSRIIRTQEIQVKNKHKTLLEMRHSKYNTAMDAGGGMFCSSERPILDKSVTSSVEEDARTCVDSKPGSTESLVTEAPSSGFDRRLLCQSVSLDKDSFDVSSLSRIFPEEISFQETQSKFASFSLSIKTDRQTLDQRIELHKRARDNAERNVTKEMDGLKVALKTLGELCRDTSSQEVFTKIQEHIGVLDQSLSRVSSCAELHGAVQQERRVSEVVDVMIVHVDNLKKLYVQKHEELETTKQEIELSESFGDGATNRTSITSNSFSKGSPRRSSIMMSSKAHVPLQQRNSSPFVSYNSDERTRYIRRQSSVLVSPSSLSNFDSLSSRFSLENLQPTQKRLGSLLDESAVINSVDNCTSKILKENSSLSNSSCMERPLENETTENNVIENWDKKEREQELLKKRREALRRSISKRLLIVPPVEKFSRLSRIHAAISSAVRYVKAIFINDTVPGLFLFAFVLIAIILLILMIRFSRLGALLGDIIALARR